MRSLLLGAVLAASMVGAAGAQDSKLGQLVPTESCTPWSRNVILGLCTKAQEAEAKNLTPQPNRPIFAKPKPKTPGESDIAIHFGPDETTALDAWIAAQPDKPSRAEAVRRLVQKGLGS